MRARASVRFRAGGPETAGLSRSRPGYGPCPGFPDLPGLARANTLLAGPAMAAGGATIHTGGGMADGKRGALVAADGPWAGKGSPEGWAEAATEAERLAAWLAMNGAAPGEAAIVYGVAASLWFRARGATIGHSRAARYYAARDRCEAEAERLAAVHAAGERATATGRPYLAPSDTVRASE